MLHNNNQYSVGSLIINEQLLLIQNTQAIFTKNNINSRI